MELSFRFRDEVTGTERLSNLPEVTQLGNSFSAGARCLRAYPL